MWQLMFVGLFPHSICSSNLALQLYRLFAKGQPVPRARLAHRLSSRPLDFVAESFNVLNHTNAVSLNQFYGPENSPIPVFTRLNEAGIPRQLQFSIDFEY